MTNMENDAKLTLKQNVFNKPDVIATRKSSEKIISFLKMIKH